jgi:hypothetical protein
MRPCLVFAARRNAGKRNLEDSDVHVGPAPTKCGEEVEAEPAPNKCEQEVEIDPTSGAWEKCGEVYPTETETLGDIDVTRAPSTWSHKSLKLLYPEGASDAITITTNQIDRLLSVSNGEAAYLDDVIMDFYTR